MIRFPGLRKVQLPQRQLQACQAGDAWGHCHTHASRLQLFSPATNADVFKGDSSPGMEASDLGQSAHPTAQRWPLLFDV